MRSGVKVYEVTREYNPPTYDIKERMYRNDQVSYEKVVYSGIKQKFAAQAIADALNRDTEQMMIALNRFYTVLHATRTNSGYYRNKPMWDLTMERFHNLQQEVLKVHHCKL